MTDTKTPVRRTARTQPAKATGAVARAPASAPTKVVAAKTAAAKAKPAASKTTAKPAAKPVAAGAPASSAKIATARPTPRAEAPKAKPMPKGDSFKMRMLVDQVVKATGAKKKGVKDVVEATLSRIGEALARGDELNLPGFGKVRVVKSDARDGTAIMTLKLRQGTAKAGQKGLAATGDDD
jgi:nucleoid DNA-binding protein